MPCIRAPRPDELEVLRTIERAAGRVFVAIGMPEIAADEPPSVAELKGWRATGRVWVAVDGRDSPVAYLLSSLVDGCAHIDQVRVALRTPGGDWAPPSSSNSRRSTSIERRLITHADVEK